MNSDQLIKINKIQLIKKVIINFFTAQTLQILVSGADARVGADQI